MQKTTKHGIRIMVETFYHPAQSEPHRGRYLHVYNIRIENRNDFPVKLLRRHWYIVEGTGVIKEVEGEGVIGKQPVIGAGQFHAYSSYCILAGEIGKMYGTYLMEDVENGGQFNAQIPPFVMVVPAKLN